MVQGYNISIFANTIFRRLSSGSRVNLNERVLIESEVQGKLKKGAIHHGQTTQVEFLSNIFLVSKKDGGNRLVVNMKYLNTFISYQNFKMEGVHLIKDLFQKNDFMIKVDLKDAYFSIPLHKDARKFMRFC